MDADGVVAPGCVDVPLEAVLFGVVLRQEVRVVECLEGGDELEVVSCQAGGHQFPEGVDSWRVFVGFEENGPGVVEPKHSVAGCRRLVFCWAEGLKKNAVVGLNNQWIS